MQPHPVLRVQDLTTCFDGDDTTVLAVDKLSFDLLPGETLGLVGESGCGKSVTSLSIMRLLRAPGRVASGSIEFDGSDLLALPEKSMRAIRGNKISMIFQEPMTALNPVYTVGDQIGEPLRQHQGLSKRQARERAIEMLKSVGIPLPERRVDDYPYQLSGGMRQRVMIAIALACDPDVLIADEPTTALDVTVQAQIFDLLREQQARRGTAVLLITHDMGAVSEMADRVVVMYGGRVVEQGSVGQILAQPRHPYTQGLIACLPELDREPGDDRPDLPEIPGVVPSVWERGAGCPFVDRCKHAMARCSREFPPMTLLDGGQGVSCWLYPEASQ